ncbi:MAG: Lrp/AsnC ligand binding domain-containing protein, partial [Candidatus Dormibacteraceae bacterium]
SRPGRRPRRRCSTATGPGRENGMKAYALINASPGQAIDIAVKLRDKPGVVSADAITGDYDVIATCEAADVNAIGQIIIEQIQKVDGVFKTITCLVVA